MIPLPGFLVLSSRSLQGKFLMSFSVLQFLLGLGFRLGFLLFLLLVWCSFGRKIVSSAIFRAVTFHLK